MTGEELLAEWRGTRLRVFKWRYDLSLPFKVMLCVGMACVTGLAAQIRIVLPFTPVPITGQVFAVLLSGVLLGRRYGAFSQALYVGLGTAGMPWFAHLTGGLAVLAGPTGGFLIGFVPAAALIGHFSERRIAFRKIHAQVALMMIAVAVIYLMGAIHLSLVMHADVWATLKMAVLPFALVDLVKAFLAAGIASAILPKTSYADEDHRG
jgi:biotin transport system substrate-specific component